MKQSRYNFFYESDNGGYIAFNALNNGLAVVDRVTAEAIKELKPGNDLSLSPDVVKELERGGFVIRDDFDEYAIIRLRNNIQQYSTDSLGLTIAPTIDCNLACTYCFEDHSHVVMDDRVADGLVTFVKGYIDSGIKLLNITWFGGEPLLCLDTIEKISTSLMELCKENKVKYSAYIITNGVLLNGKVAEKLKRLNVMGAQVTIDGSQETHDERRPFKKSKTASSFAVIRKNLEKTAGIIPLSIRVNVDKTNAGKILSFFDELGREEWFSKHLGSMITIHYGYVRDFTSSCQCTKDEILKPGEFWQEELKLQKFLKLQGAGFEIYPSISHGCTATSINGYVVGPRGELYKCWNHTGRPDSVVGNIFEPVQINPFHAAYLTENFEKDEECRSCEFLPVCMGGCPDVRIKAKRGDMDAKDCTSWKFYLEDVMKEYYRPRQTGKK